MIQKDYILREIEKISKISTALRQKLFGARENLSITLEKQIEDIKGMLLNEANFDLDKFLTLNVEESNEYINRLKGFSVENIEKFAEIFAEIGFNREFSNSKKYLEKALQLYELCNLKSKTYSVERETNISAIKNTL